MPHNPAAINASIVIVNFRALVYSLGGDKAFDISSNNKRFNEVGWNEMLSLWPG